MQEGVPDGVPLPLRPVGDAVEQPQPAGIGRQQVVGAAHDVGRVGPERLQKLRDGRTDPARRQGTGLGRTSRRPRRQLAQEAALFLVEAERVGQRLDHGGTRTGLLAAFQTYVVVDAHTGQRRQLLPAQTRRTARSGPGGQPDVCRAYAATASLQKLPELGHVVILPAGDHGSGPEPGPVTPPYGAPRKITACPAPTGLASLDG